MKKTLITLMALAGVAVADSSPFASVYVTSTEAHTSDGKPAALLLSSNGTDALSTAQLWAHGGALTFNQEANSITTSGTGTLQYLNNGLGTANIESLSYTFGATWTQNVGKASYFTAVGEDGGSTYAFRIGINTESKWTITTAGYGAITLNHQSVAAASGSGSYLVTSSKVDNTYTLSLYENGKLLVQGTGNYGFGQKNNFKVGIGGCFGTTDNAMVGTFSNISFYNEIVPEPATATLSLLALAGLAARRRRK